MASIDPYRADDARAVSALYRRVFGHDAAEGSRLRWEWQYRLNPNNPSSGPLVWIAREGPTVVGQYATMPVRLAVLGQEIGASWGVDVMIAPERQRRGLGELLFRVWDQSVGASLGLGSSESSLRLFEKLRWPRLDPVPCLVKPLTRRALRRQTWPLPLNRLVSAVTLPFVRLIARSRPLRAEVVAIRNFGEDFTAFWERVARRFDFAVRRDAAYLNWKFVDAPHVRYLTVALKRGKSVDGYAVYRHVREPRGRVTLLVDFLVDPEDEAGMKTLLRWIDREARGADSDKIRAYCAHQGFRRIMKRSGYFQVKSTMAFTAKVNAVDVPSEFYSHTDKWHVTLGDSDQDR
jgi:hypothetical protein